MTGREFFQGMLCYDLLHAKSIQLTRGLYIVTTWKPCNYYTRKTPRLNIIVSILRKGKEQKNPNERIHNAIERQTAAFLSST